MEYKTIILRKIIQMKKNSFTLLCLCFHFILFSQSSIHTSGCSLTNKYGSVSYSIGQVFCQQVLNTNGSVSQGVQQAYVISTLNLLENTFNFSLSAYPNPTSDNVTLHVGNFNEEKLNYKLLDATGKEIQKGIIEQQETMLDIKTLPSATYFLEVLQHTQKVQTFKISKNQ